MRIGQPIAIGDEKVANHALTAFVDKEGVSHDSSPLDGSIARQDLGIHVTQNHLSRPAVVPGEHTRPFPDLVLEQGTQIGGREMPEVENLHLEAPEGFRLAKRAHGGLRTASVVLRHSRRQTGEYGVVTGVCSFWLASGWLLAGSWHSALSERQMLACSTKRA